MTREGKSPSRVSRRIRQTFARSHARFHSHSYTGLSTVKFEKQLGRSKAHRRRRSGPVLFRRREYFPITHAPLRAQKTFRRPKGTKVSKWLYPFARSRDVLVRCLDKTKKRSHARCLRVRRVRYGRPVSPQQNGKDNIGRRRLADRAMTRRRAL